LLQQASLLPPRHSLQAALLHSNSSGVAGQQQQAVSVMLCGTGFKIE
jgi:hypothetical protein